MNTALNKDTVIELHTRNFGKKPDAVSHAPGRIEILGNHTDYNDGFVLSCAIDMGTYCTVSPSDSSLCRLIAPNMNDSVEFNIDRCAPVKASWANYLVGVTDFLGIPGTGKTGFDLTVSTDIPMGSGLSSSAALEVSCAMALSELYNLSNTPLELARICQKSEHEYTGAKCGLLDQLSSLHGAEHCLVFIDFRTFEIQTIPLDNSIRFMMANTAVSHNLAESEYNSRRECCESASAFFSSRLDRDIHALRDVTMEDWDALHSGMDDETASRALHVIGENTRVVQSMDLIRDDNYPGFGKLMFDSHESSRDNFENSCPELDFIVKTSRDIDGVLGARLSGGGFGGSAVLMVRDRDTDTVSHVLSSRYATEYGTPCAIREITPSRGAAIVYPAR